MGLSFPFCKKDEVRVLGPRRAAQPLPHSHAFPDQPLKPFFTCCLHHLLCCQQLQEDPPRLRRPGKPEHGVHSYSCASEMQLQHHLWDSSPDPPQKHTPSPSSLTSIFPTCISSAPDRSQHFLLRPETLFLPPAHLPHPVLPLFLLHTSKQTLPHGNITLSFPQPSRPIWPLQTRGPPLPSCHVPLLWPIPCPAPSTEVCALFPTLFHWRCEAP